MRTAQTEQPSTQRTDRATPSTGTAAPLAALGQVPWDDIRDSTGSAAGIPRLLDRVARGDAESARAALDELRTRICQYGFVVEQATAATVPFLWELAQLPHVTCRPQIIQLLKSIADARQWEDVAAVYPKVLNHRENPVVWERRARQAVRARRGALRVLLADQDRDIARATTELAAALGA
ncbi:hypothetical protein [Streptomyces naganishii]|uniref:AbaA n=1 Tax=Streptomyces naganishii JCM 4654 TaxID=1306179 RepID=A0A918Y2B9_9ACTN|nr:hypothetical protein [Streptomyces naganishii]GHD87598.1 hypothetical protein GCM10010508_20360 [Streptomyces naganishii JCM 4654]